MGDKVDIELDKKLKLGIIAPVNEPIEWVNELVVTGKPNGKLIICLDPCHLNEAILRERYEMPTAEQLFSEMSGAKFFTNQDCSNGYWQIAVVEESSKLLMFIYYKRCFRFTRLPYGIYNVWYPIAFASRTLGKSERNYCQLEKETLSIVFAYKKFHHYIYGQQFLIENDHKPLQSTFKKPINKPHLDYKDLCFIYKDMILKYSSFQENKLYLLTL